MECIRGRSQHFELNKQKDRGYKMEAWNKHLTDGEREIIYKKIEKEVSDMDGTFAQKETKRKFMQGVVNDMSVHALYKMGWFDKDQDADFDYDIDLDIPVTLRIKNEPEKKITVGSLAIADDTLQKIFRDIDEYILTNIMRNR